MVLEAIKEPIEPTDSVEDLNHPKCLTSPVAQDGGTSKAWSDTLLVHASTTVHTKAKLNSFIKHGLFKVLQCFTAEVIFWVVLNVSLSSNLWPYHRLAAGGGDQTLSLIATVEGLCLARHSGMILGLVDIFLLQKWVTLVMGSQAERCFPCFSYYIIHRFTSYSWTFQSMWNGERQKGKNTETISS